MCVLMTSTKALTLSQILMRYIYACENLFGLIVVYEALRVLVWFSPLRRARAQQGSLVSLHLLMLNILSQHISIVQQLIIAKSVSTVIIYW